MPAPADSARCMAPPPCCLPAGVGNVGHFNEGSHNLGSYNTGSRNVGDKSMCSLCVGHGLNGFGLLGPPAVFLPASAAEPTKEEL